MPFRRGAITPRVRSPGPPDSAKATDEAPGQQAAARDPTATARARGLSGRRSGAGAFEGRVAVRRHVRPAPPPHAGSARCFRSCPSRLSARCSGPAIRPGVSSASSHSERFREVDSVPTARIPFRHAGSVEAPGCGGASPEGEWTIRAASASCAHVLCMFSCAHEPSWTDRPRFRHSATAHADQHGRPRLGCSARCRAARRRGRDRARCRRLAAPVSSRSPRPARPRRPPS